MTISLFFHSTISLYHLASVRGKVFKRLLYKSPLFITSEKKRPDFILPNKHLLGRVFLSALGRGRTLLVKVSHFGVHKKDSTLLNSNNVLG